jgi:glycosyltransferase involved in cell wall biosynthesis
MSSVQSTHESRPLVSIVVPALNESDNVPGLLQRFGDFAVRQPDYDFELVLVDDGSTDGTADRLMELTPAGSRVTVIRLSRSFGSHYAISAGLARCAGDCAVVFGADLQEPPSLLADFLTGWEQGSDVVWGVRRTRTGRSAMMELASKAFTSSFTRYAGLSNYPPEGPSGVLLDRLVIDEVGRLPERNRNILALIAWLGFTQTRVEYDQEARRHGTSRWTRRKMIKLAIDSWIQFTSLPLRLSSFVGVTVAFLGLVYALVLIVRSLIGVSTPAGWATVIVIVLVVGGTQLTMVGVMGEYLWRSVEESRGRPLYVIRDVRVAGAPAAIGSMRRRARAKAPSAPDLPPEQVAGGTNAT